MVTLKGVMQPWSWTIGRLFGIETRVHASFLLVLVWAAYSSYAGAGTLTAVVVGLLFLAGVFASVVAHELGHALTARAFGYDTRQILLLPIGGVAQIDGAHMSPRQELLVALAGPVVSFVLAGTLFTLGAVTGDVTPSSFLGALAWANLGVAVFNLIPAFPLDGGRVLRAGLASRLGSFRATQIAATVGKTAAVALGVYALLTGRTFLALIAAFVYLAARSEAAAVRPRHADERHFPRGHGGLRGWPRGMGEHAAVFRTPRGPVIVVRRDPEGWN